MDNKQVLIRLYTFFRQNIPVASEITIKKIIRSFYPHLLVPETSNEDNSTESNRLFYIKILSLLQHPTKDKIPFQNELNCTSYLVQVAVYFAHHNPDIFASILKESLLQQEQERDLAQLIDFFDKIDKLNGCSLLADLALCLFETENAISSIIHDVVMRLLSRFKENDQVLKDAAEYCKKILRGHISEYQDDGNIYAFRRIILERARSRISNDGKCNDFVKALKGIISRNAYSRVIDYLRSTEVKDMFRLEEFDPESHPHQDDQENDSLLTQKLTEELRSDTSKTSALARLHIALLSTLLDPHFRCFPNDPNESAKDYKKQKIRFENRKKMIISRAETRSQSSETRSQSLLRDDGVGGEEYQREILTMLWEFERLNQREIYDLWISRRKFIFDHFENQWRAIYPTTGKGTKGFPVIGVDILVEIYKTILQHFLEQENFLPPLWFPFNSLSELKEKQPVLFSALCRAWDELRNFSHWNGLFASIYDYITTNHPDEWEILHKNIKWRPEATIPKYNNELPKIS